ncbi:MAG: hypothetical protein MZV64_30260 [Ignavibacteriales bacterium]|nr:hypothetical protein [Ignavibacteriales bacterium]
MFMIQLQFLLATGIPRLLFMMILMAGIIYNYGGQEEFYNDFSNFDVSITLPNNFGVWATGELQNPEEVLTENILERYSAAKESDDVVRIVTTERSESFYNL